MTLLRDVWSQEKFLLDGEDIYGDMDVNLLRKRVGMVFQNQIHFQWVSTITLHMDREPTESVPKSKLDDIVEKSLPEMRRSGMS